MIPAPVIALLGALAITDWLDPDTLIRTFGMIGIFIIVFVENGLLFGFFLPGDSLLFTAGLLASQGFFAIEILVPGIVVSAFLGDQVGYWIGRRLGPALFRKPDSRVFKQQYVEKSREFFERYGPKTLIISRFVPIVRTCAPILAGVGNMRYRTFVTFNVVGACIWGIGVTLLGFFLGETVPGIEDYLLPIIALIVVLSIMPAVIEIHRARRRHRATAVVPDHVSGERSEPLADRVAEVVTGESTSDESDESGRDEPERPAGYRAGIVSPDHSDERTSEVPGL